MKKLTNEELEVLVAKRNEIGSSATVVVMNNEELARYRVNCIEAIERQDNRIAKAKVGGYMQQSAIELKEILEGYVAYIDAKLSEVPAPTGEEIIDAFLSDWKEKANQAYTELKAEFDAIKDRKQRITFLWKLPKSTASLISHPSFLVKLHYGLEHEVARKKAHLMHTIAKKAGNIVDASGLYVGVDGNINGVVVGDLKTVTVKTIYAGGYNIQALHYRVLVK